VINRLLMVRGNLTTSKYAALAKCSTDTALRDIQELVGRGVLVANAGAVGHELSPWFGGSGWE